MNHSQCLQVKCIFLQSTVTAFQGACHQTPQGWACNIPDHTLYSSKGPTTEFQPLFPYMLYMYGHRVCDVLLKSGGSQKLPRRHDVQLYNVSVHKPYSYVIYTHPVYDQSQAITKGLYTYRDIMSAKLCRQLIVYSFHCLMLFIVVPPQPTLTIKQ